MAAKKLRNYPEANMLAALEDIRWGIPYKTAARQHNVPRVTLMDKHKGKVPVSSKMGPSSVFSPEQEAGLIEWVKCMAKAGFPVSKETFLNSAGKLAKELNVKFGKNSTPGRKWINLFLTRHPELSLRVSQNLTTMRRNVTQENINGWFAEVQDYIKTFSFDNILLDPSRVFNSDETAFFLNPKPGKVLVEKGSKTVYTVAGNDEKLNLTVLLTANAKGDIAPPMVVFRYSRIPQMIAESVPPQWAIGKSRNGWMTHELFYEYMANIFLLWLKDHEIQLPVIFFMDGHTSHISLPLSQFCKEQGIELVALYPNATHILQPMDVAVFHCLKTVWRQKVQEWRMENNGSQLRKHDFAPLLEQTLKSISPTTIENGFRKCGLVPFDPNAIKVNRENEDQRPKGESSRDCQKFCTTLESYIGNEKLRQFSESGGEWSGNPEVLSLFNLWNKVRKEAKNEVKATVEVIEEHDKPISSQENLAMRQLTPPASSMNDREVNDEAPEQTEQSELENSEPNTSHGNTTIDQVELVPDNEPSGEPIPSTSSLNLKDHMSPPKKMLSDKIPDFTLPSPFKRALLWPEPKNSPKAKRRKEKLPAVVTSPQMIEYFKKKEQQKAEAQRQQEERKQLREIKRKTLEDKKQERLRKKKKVIEEDISSETDSDGRVSLLDSDRFEWDEISDEEEEEVMDVKTLTEVKEGDFIMVEYKGGKRMATNFIYLCVIQKIISEEEIEIMGLRSTDSTKKQFVVQDNDLSIINLKQIMGKVRQPEVVVTGERLSYQFPHSLQVKEM